MALWSVIKSSRKETHLNLSCLSAQIHILPLDSPLEKGSLTLSRSSPQLLASHAMVRTQVGPHCYCCRRVSQILLPNLSLIIHPSHLPHGQGEGTQYNPPCPAWTVLTPTNFSLVSKIVTKQPGKGLQLLCATCSGQQPCL